MKIPLAALCTVCFGAAALIGLVDCHSQQDGENSFPREETLYLGGMQWGEPTSFNPLLSEPAWPIPSGDGFYNVIYEALLQFNAETGKMQPALAESYTMNDDAIDVVLNPAAKWNDGQPVTALDVQYSFELGQKYKSLRVSPRWTYIHAIRLEGDRHVIFELEKERRNPLVVLDALQETAILPRHVFEPLFAQSHGDLDEFTKLKLDHDPVGSGPYRLHSYSGEKIVLVRDDNYWGNAALHHGKRPAPKYVVAPIYKSNDNFSIALQQGRLDASICFVPRIWLKQKKGVRSWYDKEPFFVSASIPMLVPNVTHRPLGDVHMRRAIAFAINYKDIRELAVSGYSEPLKPGLILPFGLEGKYYSEEDAREFGAVYDPTRAKEILKEGGFTPVFDPNGELVETRDARGVPVPTVYIKSPTGWTDWESIVSIVVKNLRDVGIDARERFVDANLYYSARLVGDFDLLMLQPVPAPTPSQPWARFEAVIASRDWAPDGEKMYKNMGRFNNPKSPDYVARIDQLIELIPTLKDEGELLVAYRELNKLFMQTQAAFPLVYRPDQFYEVSIRHWDNFPNAKNPYVPAQVPSDRLGTDALWALRPAGAH